MLFECVVDEMSFLCDAGNFALSGMTWKFVCLFARSFIHSFHSHGQCPLGNCESDTEVGLL